MVSVEVWCDHDLHICSWIAGRFGTNIEGTMPSVIPMFMEILSDRFDMTLPMNY